MMKTVSVAALVLASATASFAGSLNTNYEAEPAKAPVLPVAGSGIGAPAIIGGLVAAGVIAALVSNDDDNDSVVDHPIAD